VSWEKHYCLPVQPRVSHDGAKASTAREIEGYDLVSGDAVESPVGTKAQTTGLRNSTDPLAYRSAISYKSDEQKRITVDTIADVDASGLWPGKVVTEVAPAGDFWQAEPEHQDYLERYPNGYTYHFVRPGLEAAREESRRGSVAGKNLHPLRKRVRQTRTILPGPSLTLPASELKCILECVVGGVGQVCAEQVYTEPAAC
jgi:hypothetical protein